MPVNVPSAERAGTIAGPTTWSGQLDRMAVLMTGTFLLQVIWLSVNAHHGSSERFAAFFWSTTASRHVTGWLLGIGTLTLLAWTELKGFGRGRRGWWTLAFFFLGTPALLTLKAGGFAPYAAAGLVLWY